MSLLTILPRGSRRVGADLDLVPLAFAMGMAGGLIEGAGHMLLQALNFLDNSWYPIIWIAAFFNALLVSLGALVLAAISAMFGPRDRIRGLAVFAITIAACVPWTALILKQWMQSYAILLLTIGIAVAFARAFRRDETAVLKRARAGLPWLVGVSLLALVSIEGGSRLQERIATSRLPAAANDAPNVLVVVVDTLRADHLSTYGYSRATSPTIDRFAREGVLFENAIAASSYTLPSHVSILSGLYGNQHGIEWHNSHGSQRRTYPVLPQVLLGHGYRTGAFSGNTFYFAREHGFGRGFLHFEDYFHSFADRMFRTAFGGIATHAMRRLGYLDLPGRKLATDANREVLDWLGEDRHPFFVVVNYLDAHDPYLPPAPYRNKFTATPNPGGLINAEVFGQRQLSSQEFDSEVAAYDGAIAYVDAQIDTLIKALRARSPSRELLVVLTSDHGEEFGEHGAYMHARSLYREVIHVPLIVWKPGQVPAGRRIGTPVSNAAIPATVMDLLGLDGSMFGVKSVGPLWKDGGGEIGAPAPRSDLKQRPWAEEGSPVRLGTLQSVVTPDYHFIESDHGTQELFAPASDPGESKNLVGQPSLKSEVDRHRALLK